LISEDNTESNNILSKDLSSLKDNNNENKGFSYNEELVDYYDNFYN